MPHQQLGIVSALIQPHHKHWRSLYLSSAVLQCLLKQFPSWRAWYLPISCWHCPICERPFGFLGKIVGLHHHLLFQWIIFSLTPEVNMQLNISFAALTRLFVTETFPKKTKQEKDNGVGLYLSHKLFYGKWTTVSVNYANLFIFLKKQ